MALLARKQRRMKDLSMSNWDTRYTLPKDESIDVEAYELLDLLTLNTRRKAKKASEKTRAITGVCRNNFLVKELDRRREL